MEPPRSHPTRLPQAEFVCSWGTRLWGWPEQQVGETEHPWFAGCDSPFRAGYRTPAGTGHKAGRYCCSSQLVNKQLTQKEKCPQHFHCQSLCLSCKIETSQSISCLFFVLLNFFFSFFSCSLYFHFSPSKRNFIFQLQKTQATYSTQTNEHIAFFFTLGQLVSHLLCVIATYLQPNTHN